MLRLLLLAFATGPYAMALEIHPHSAGVFQIVHSNGMVPASDLARSVPIFKANHPAEIILVFPSNYPVEGDENTPWSKLWYRRELTKLAHSPDGWELRSIRFTERPKP